ncbi:MAG: AtpZ/AtpI family protein [Balneolaceae bacterium]|nr:AtpZ/AtpI family protein [Balneolaceae bacterium]
MSGGSDRKQADREKDSRSAYSRYAPYLSLGAEIAVGVTAPVLLGYWLDQKLDTSPWLMLLGILAGMANIFLLIYRLYKDLG